jgi:hypothetical protein
LWASLFLLLVTPSTRLQRQTLACSTRTRVCLSSTSLQLLPCGRSWEATLSPSGRPMGWATPCRWRWKPLLLLSALQATCLPWARPTQTAPRATRAWFVGTTRRPPGTTVRSCRVRMPATTRAGPSPCRPTVMFLPWVSPDTTAAGAVFASMSGTAHSTCPAGPLSRATLQETPLERPCRCRLPTEAALRSAHPTATLSPGTRACTGGFRGTTRGCSWPIRFSPLSRTRMSLARKCPCRPTGLGLQ